MVIKTLLFLLMFNFLAYSSEKPENIFLVIDNVTDRKFCVNSVFYYDDGLSLRERNLLENKFCEGVLRNKKLFADFEFKKIFLTNFTIITIK